MFSNFMIHIVNARNEGEFHLLVRVTRTPKRLKQQTQRKSAPFGLLEIYSRFSEIK